MGVQGEGTLLVDPLPELPSMEASKDHHPPPPPAPTTAAADVAAELPGGLLGWTIARVGACWACWARWACSRGVLLPRQGF